MLKFNEAWRFDSPGPISDGVRHGFSDLIGKIAAQGDRQKILEHFKGYFASAAGTTSIWSSSESWAESDLHDLMSGAAENAPLFVEAFYEACVALRARHPQFAVPDVNRINRVLTEHNAGYQVQPPHLVSTSQHEPVAVPARAASLSEQAHELIHRSLQESERLLSEGRDRQAVQEVLWLLETVSTAFQGVETETGTIGGKYFNKIAEDLRRHHRGQCLDQVLGWITSLHGYLSSPTGGGIRHGTNLREGVVTQPHEARLFCNLVRSYIAFLMSEHERLTSRQ